MQPLQGSHAQSSGAGHSSKRKAEEQPAEDDEKHKDRKILNLQNQLKNMQAGSSNRQKKELRMQSKGGKSAGKKGSGKGPRMPAELIGMESSFKGEPICFGWNLDGCEKALPGKKCQHGWHVCAKSGCLKLDHGQPNHS